MDALLGLALFAAIGALVWYVDSGRMSARAMERDAERRRIIREVEREWARAAAENDAFWADQEGP